MGVPQGSPRVSPPVPPLTPQMLLLLLLLWAPRTGALEVEHRSGESGPLLLSFGTAPTTPTAPTAPAIGWVVRRRSVARSHSRREETLCSISFQAWERHGIGPVERRAACSDAIRSKPTAAEEMQQPSRRTFSASSFSATSSFIEDTSRELTSKSGSRQWPLSLPSDSQSTFGGSYYPDEQKGYIVNTGSLAEDIMSPVGEHLVEFADAGSQYISQGFQESDVQNQAKPFGDYKYILFNEGVGPEETFGNRNVQTPIVPIPMYSTHIPERTLYSPERPYGYPSLNAEMFKMQSDHVNSGSIMKNKQIISPIFINEPNIQPQQIYPDFLNAQRIRMESNKHIESDHGKNVSLIKDSSDKIDIYNRNTDEQHLRSPGADLQYTTTNDQRILGKASGENYRHRFPTDRRHKIGDIEEKSRTSYQSFPNTITNPVGPLIYNENEDPLKERVPVQQYSLLPLNEGMGSNTRVASTTVVDSSEFEFDELVSFEERRSEAGEKALRRAGSGEQLTGPRFSSEELAAAFNRSASASGPARAARIPGHLQTQSAVAGGVPRSDIPRRTLFPTYTGRTSSYFE